MSVRPVVCALLTPWPLHLLGQARPDVPLAVLGEDRRVLHANGAAVAGGVRAGMREQAAVSRCPDLHAEVVTAPVAAQAWTALLETLHARFSDHVEGRSPGVAFLHASPGAARELAVAFGARVGVAGSVEVAHLAALRAVPGEVRELQPDAERAYLPLALTAHLGVLGVTDAQVERLHFLGVRGLADLMAWSAAQRGAFLGAGTGRRVNRFLRGERCTRVARYTPDRTLHVTRALDEPLHEPHEAAALLGEAVPELWAALRGRTAASMSVHAVTPGGRLSGTRRLKWPLQEAGLRRAAERLLLDSGALALGVDAVTLECSGLQQPARQVGLWPDARELDAVQEVLERYPDALVRVEWRDPYALVADAQYVWVDWLTGAERPRPMRPCSVQAAPLAPAGAPEPALSPPSVVRAAVARSLARDR